VLRQLPEVIWYRDLPTFHPSDVPHAAVSRRCRQDGVKVLLTGEGADELFGGYAWQRQTWERWRRWRRLAPFLGRRRRQRRYERLHFSPVIQITTRRDRNLRRRFAAAVEPERQLRPVHLFDRLEAVEPVEDRAHLVQCLDDLHVHLGNILRRHDRAGMIASLEMRVPFLENHVIDLALHLARTWKLRRGATKWALKQVALEHLPRDVVHAPKKGFPIPPQTMRGAAHLLRDGAVARLFEWSRTTQALLLPQIEREVFFRNQMVTLEVWARLFLEGASPDAVSDQLLRAAGVTPSGPATRA
jgi:asparagine synthase (glutamine-hydrolysing)